MKAEAEQNAENDKKERERIDKLNQADSLIFTTENFLKDNGDKIPADKKAPIEGALQQLKDAHKSADIAAIDSAITNLNNIMQAASQQMYQGAQGQPGADQALSGLHVVSALVAEAVCLAERVATFVHSYRCY